MEQLSEIEILIQLRESRESAFEQIYEKYWRQLYLIAYKRLKDKTLAEDLVQDVLLGIWHRRHSLQIHTSLGAYLVQAMKYAVLNTIRSMVHREDFARGMISRLQQNSPTPEDIMDHRDTERLLMNGIDALPDKCRQVFRMSRFEHLTYQEIAEKLAISPKTVENQISKALKVLKVSLGSLSIFLCWYFIHRL
jgi:RNA polymerase sigma-70 factor (family 1)